MSRISQVNLLLIHSMRVGHAVYSVIRLRDVKVFMRYLINYFSGDLPNSQQQTFIPKQMISIGVCGRHSKALIQEDLRHNRRISAG